MTGAVVVTGAAGALGRAVVQRLADTGWTVVAIQRSTGDSPPNGAAAVVTTNDLSSERECKRAFADVRQSAQSLHGLVNLAGGFVWEKFVEGEVSTWDSMFAVNVKTTFNSCKEALPLMAAGGAIVNVGAASAHRGAVGMGGYSASKSSVARLTESLAEELKPNIRVNAVLPSIIDTSANRGAMPKADFFKWVTPLEVANVIAFLLSNDSSGVTGALIPVTGRV